MAGPPLSRRAFVAAAVTVPADRPQLTPEEAESATREAHLGDRAPWKDR
ncbi:hypothetical protein [Streptomyces sp. 142MFCol3.1]|nr:hypothetical protein [Streptomyces sp. 142MFCol3.1]